MHLAHLARTDRAARPALAALLALAAGCSHDLALPSDQPLAIEPAAASVAPRQPLALSASGGSGGYAFRFAAGGKLSGDDATVNGTSGAYQAGARGSAQDLVEVVDSVGRVATARIGVGPRLALTPSLAGTAPGGTVALVASGGKPPYAFELLAAPGSGSTLRDGSTYVAGASAGDVVERVRVTDTTGDPAARAEAEVRVGRALSLFRAGTGAVAPGETLDVVALGGQPPYRYLVVQDGSGGASVDVAGRLHVGSSGPATVKVGVEDAHLQVATLDVPVGPPLALALPTAELRPGAAVQLSASGGKPPYAYAFARRGNRSRGSVVQVTGEYRPGPVVFATDLLEVTDAAGVTASLLAAPVDGFSMATGTGTFACGVGDLNGDGRADLVALRMGERGGADLITWWLAASGPSLQTVYTPGGWDSPLVVDLDGRGQADVLFTTRTYLSEPDGSLTAGPFMPSGALWNYPRFLVPVRQPTGELVIQTDAGCSAPTGSGLATWTWRIGPPDVADAALECVGAPATGRAVRFSAGRLLDRSVTTVAWLVEEGGYRSAGPLHLGNPPGSGLALQIDVSLPLGLVFQGDEPLQMQKDFAALPVDSFEMTDLAMILRDAAGRAHVAVLHQGAFLETVDPDPTAPPAVGLTLVERDGAGYTLATWNGVDGRLGGVRVEGTTVRRVGTLAGEVSFAVTCAGFGDATGDGLPDLFAAGTSSPRAVVLPGDGMEVARRPHFAAARGGATGDLDGDGLDELLTATGDGGLRVERGAAHQLAAGAETPLASAPSEPLYLGGVPPQAAWIDQSDGVVRVATLDSDGRVVNVARLAAASGTLPLLDATQDTLQAADLGGPASGSDLWTRRYDPVAGERLLEVMLRDAAGTAAWHQAPSPVAGSFFRYAPTGPAGGPASAFTAVGHPAGAPLPVVYRASFAPAAAGGPFGAWEKVGEIPVGGLDLLGDDHGLATYLAYDLGWAQVVRVGSAGLPTQVQLQPGASGGDALWSDLDGDGALDLILTAVMEVGVRPSSFAVYFGDGAGGFLPGQPFQAVGTPVAAVRTVAGAPRDLVLLAGNSFTVQAVPARPAR